MRSLPSASAMWKCRRRRNACGVPSRIAARRLRSARLFHIAGLDQLRMVGLSRKRGENFLHMGAVARLHGDVKPRTFGRHVEEQPLVVDLQDIGTEYTKPCRDHTKD